MALVHEFENSGNWLFKRRSWLPVVIILAGLLMLYLGNRQAIIFDLRDEMIFFGISMAGQLIRVFTVGYTPKNTSGRNTAAGQVADELNTTGIYSVIRHPLYVGNLLMWLGPVLFLRSAWFTVVFFLVYWLYYERIIFAEEQFLRRKFGEAYDKYSEKVKSFIPFHVRYVSCTLPFSFRNVLKREYNSFFNVFAVFAVLDISRNFILTEKLSVTPVWMWLFVAAAGIWLTVRVIKKATRWLEVEGR